MKNDARMTPKPDLPGELYDVEERDRAPADDMANPEFNLMLNEDGTEFKAPEPSPNDPPAGSWAATARVMVSFGNDDGFDWDSWKDEMKTRDF